MCNILFASSFCATTPFVMCLLRKNDTYELASPKACGGELSANPQGPGTPSSSMPDLRRSLHQWGRETPVSRYGGVLTSIHREISSFLLSSAMLKELYQEDPASLFLGFADIPGDRDALAIVFGAVLASYQCVYFCVSLSGGSLYITNIASAGGIPQSLAVEGEREDFQGLSREIWGFAHERQTNHQAFSSMKSVDGLLSCTDVYRPLAGVWFFASCTSKRKHASVVGEGCLVIEVCFAGVDFLSVVELRRRSFEVALRLGARSRIRA
ncbi:hypothetical protein B0H19DRAFT_1229848 [Mycena capillaripes]|nr:hypothetical protein B0H19DRAFT_1229848 [Mycena capillaripes]